MRAVIFLVALAACGDSSLTLRDAYREISAVTCEANLRCRGDVYLAEYGTTDLEPCIQSLVAAELGTRDGEAPAVETKLNTCMDDLSAMTCAEWLSQGQWPGACVTVGQP